MHHFSLIPSLPHGSIAPHGCTVAQASPNLPPLPCCTWARPADNGPRLLLHSHGVLGDLVVPSSEELGQLGCRSGNSEEEGGKKGWSGEKKRGGEGKREGGEGDGEGHGNFADLVVPSSEERGLSQIGCK